MAEHRWDPRRAAAMGAFYLDAVKPDWFRVIKLRTLRLQSETSCVLGQCFHDYFDALGQLVPAFNGEDDSISELYQNRRDFAERFGFQVPVSQQNGGGYERLGLAWKALIRRRRAKTLRHRRSRKAA